MSRSSRPPKPSAESGGSLPQLFEALRLEGKLAARSLFRQRLLVFFGALTLGVGIAANVTLFSFFNGIYLRPLPYPEPAELVSLYGFQEATGRRLGLSSNEIRELRSADGTFQAVAAYRKQVMNLTGLERPERLSTIAASWEVLTSLGVSPIRGRLFSPEDKVSGAPVVVLSHQLWATSLGSDETLGQTLQLDGQPHTVIGVLPPDFTLLRQRPDLYVLERIPPAGDRRSYEVFARLAEDSTLSRAASTVQGVAGQLSSEDPDRYSGLSLTAAPLRDDVLPSKDVGRLAPVMLTAVAMVLLVACANAGGLLLARAVRRRRELSIRAALGARRRRLALYLFSESGVLAALGGIVGVALAEVGVRAILALTPAGNVALFDFSLDLRLLLFTAAICAASTIFAGWVPMTQLFGGDLAGALRTSTLSSGRGRWNRILVISETALAFTLLVAASVVLQGLREMHSKDLGFEPDNLLSLRLDPASTAYQDEAALGRFYDVVEERLAALPGVTGVGSTNDLTLTGADTVAAVAWAGEESSGEQSRAARVSVRTVSPGYLPALGVHIVEGRGPGTMDTAAGAPIAAVNVAFVRRFGNDGRILGRQLSLWDGSWRIVGVVQDFYEVRLDRPLLPTVYLAAAQAGPRARSLVVRTRGGVSSEDLRRAVWEVDADQPIALLRSMPDIVSRQAWVFKTMSALLTIFAGLAWGLASVGLYSVMAYSVGQRVNEIGVRMALGADRRRILRLLLGEGLRLSVIAVVIGAPLAYLGSRGLAKIFFGVSSAGWPVLLGATALTLLTTLVACVRPAWRAASADPNLALRQS